MRCAAAWLALSLAGCGAQLGDPPPTASPVPGGKGDGDGSAEPISATRYVTALASKECNEAFMCQASFPSDLGDTFTDEFSTSVQACNDLLVDDWQPDTLESEIAQGRLGFDGAAAAACLDAITFGDCVDFFHAGPHWAAPCYQMFTPMVPQGGACELDDSCTTGTCDQTTQTCT